MLVHILIFYTIYIYYIYIGIYPTHRHPHGPPTRSPVDHRADTRRCGPAHGRRTPAAAPAGGSWDPPPGKMRKKGWFLQQSSGFSGKILGIL